MIQPESKLSYFMKRSVPYPYLYAENGFIYRIADETHCFPVARDIYLDAIRENIETDEVTLCLSTKFQGVVKSVEISRGNLQKKDILGISKYGFDIYDHNATLIIQHILNEECEFEDVQLNHSQIGFGEYYGQNIFKHNTALGIHSTYCGKLKIEPVGRVNTWHKMVRKYVLGNPPLELALALGLSAAVVGFIGRDVSMDTLIAHLYNDSTKGKTTALMLALSPFGCPDPRVKFSLANTWNNTDNFLVSLLNGNFGLPFGLDEASMLGNNPNYSALLYRLASNRDKGRLNKSAEPREMGDWNTVIISTGEFSLLSKSFQNSGLRMRVLELGHITWTPDAKTAEAIKAIVLTNYGRAGVLFAEHLLNIGKEAVIECWQQWREKIKTTIPDAADNPFADRHAAKLAPIMVAADLAQTPLKLKFDLDAMLKILLDSQDNDDELVDIDTKAYDYFMQVFNKYRRHFGIPENVPTKYEIYYDCDGKKSLNVDLWGTTRVKHDNSRLYICILPTEFDRIMTGGGFPDPKSIIKKWKDKGLLDCEKDRLTRKVKLSVEGTVIPLYCIKYNLHKEKSLVSLDNLLAKKKAQAATNKVKRTPKAKTSSPNPK